MIITRTPLRITLGGGGTDLASYYSKYGGFVISAAIQKYIYVTINDRFYDQIRLAYSKIEIVDSVEQINHPIIREALRLFNITKAVEISTIGEVPSGTGLGSSSSFTVGLLNALYTYNRMNPSKKELAEKACEIEIDILKEPIGKQDQYISTFGGIICLNIDKNGDVSVEPLKVSEGTIRDLLANTIIFYTGIERSASEILKDQKEASERNEVETLKALHKIKENGKEIKKCLEEGDLHRYGELLNEYWQIKKTLSPKISNSFFNEIYDRALKNGAIGGKIMGAGGGGFMMLYCENNKNNLRKEMLKLGLREIPIYFDFNGTYVIANSR